MNRAVRATLSLFSAFFIALALSSYCISDPSFLNRSIVKNKIVYNHGGLLGANLSDLLYRAFGASAWVLPIMTLHLLKCDLQKKWKWSIVAGWALGIITLSLFAEIFVNQGLNPWPYTPGGYFAAWLVYRGPWLIGGSGLLFANTLCFFAACFLILQIDPLKFFAHLVLQLMSLIKNVAGLIVWKKPQKEKKSSPIESHILPIVETLKQSQIATAAPTPSSDHFQEQAHKIIEKLKEYDIHGKITDIIPGPVIVRFELQLAAGERSQKVASLSKDLARVLKLGHLNVVQHIPGKAVMGLEIPQKNRQAILFLPLLSQIPKEYTLPLALGVTPQSEPVLLDLAKLPHLLVAGATGSGKSVAMNTMLMSLLTTRSAQQLKLVLIDPKILEFACYKDRAHLAMPVISEPEHAVAALRWCVKVMQDRYKILANHHVQHISQYHQKVSAQEAATMPYLVVVIDELADLMLMTKKAVEEPIARIAQKARACGIHLVIATQRPSVDVITGLIKANIPARLAFAVSSKIDSRTIIDQQGAEDLLGSGDSYLLTPSSHTVARVHGAFLTDSDRQKLLETCSPVSPNYMISIEKVISDYSEGSFEDADF